MQQIIRSVMGQRGLEVLVLISAHMTNDSNWLVNKELNKQEYCNRMLDTDLGLVAKKDINAREEIYVGYSYDRQA